MPILDLDEARGQFDHICTGFIPAYPGAQVGRACLLRRTGLRLKDDVTVQRHEDGRAYAAVICPTCGACELLNLALGPEDEDDEALSHPHREQSQHIRALMAHPDVGLHDLVRDCRCKDCMAVKSKEAGGGTQRRRRQG